MINISDKSKCCGCSACFSNCPKNCISMSEDNEGFLYPTIDKALCINCNACEKVCPFFLINGVERNNSSLFAVQYNNIDRMQSSAGGAFSLIADYLIENDFVVFAVGFDELIKVVHKKAINKSELIEMCGAKYVQSTLGETFDEIRDLLQKGEKVLFVGTPCQTHGLVNYIGSKENLFIIDLLCLGVSSPGLFNKYIAWLNEKYNKSVKSVQFRNKKYGYSVSNVRVYFNDGNYIEQKYDSKVYTDLFFKHYYNVRPSCYECEFRDRPRISDFTIGDFTEIGQYSKVMDDDKGTTKLWVHTEKGHTLLENIQERYSKISINENVSNIIGGPKKQICYPPNRQSFFYDYGVMDFSSFVKKWDPQTVRYGLVGFARNILNRFPFKNKIFKILRAIKRKKYLKRVVNLNK